jgi:hypothetical protein
VGASADGSAVLTLDNSLQCEYVGDGSSDPSAQGAHGGTKYVFSSCSDGTTVAGSSVSATYFHLHVVNGDHRGGGANHKSASTAVRLVIDETRPCDPTTRGEVAFHTALPQGNGRSCGDCHMESDSFQLSPADVQARYDAMITSGVDDPLFRDVDRDNDGTNDYANLRQNALIRIHFSTPNTPGVFPQIKLVDPASCQTTTGTPAPCQTAPVYATTTDVDVWRSVPTVNNVKITGPDNGLAWARDPNRQGGYQLDARVSNLEAQALGAFQGHIQVSPDPTPGMLSDIAAYEESLNTAPMPDDSTLTALELSGKTIFLRACGQCHGGAGMSTPIPTVAPATPIPHYHDIATACPRPVDTVNPPRR